MGNDNIGVRGTQLCAKSDAIIPGYMRYIPRTLFTISTSSIQSLLRSSSRGKAVRVIGASVAFVGRQIVLYAAAKDQQASVLARVEGLLGAPNVEFFSHSDQVYDRICLHLVHKMTAVNFDSNLNHPKFSSNLFVEPTCDDQAHYLAFALR